MMKRHKKRAIAKINGVSNKTASTLMEQCCSVKNNFEEKKKELLAIPYIRNATVDAILSKNSLAEAERELAFIEKHHIQALWMEDANYPRRLRECEDAPLLLYYKGAADLNPER